MITFHAEKDAINRKKHGISLARAAEFDFESAQFVVDDRKDYGEARYRFVGFLDARLHVLVLTYRGDETRIISLRKATRHEEKEFQQNS